jgi:hypothetical protein
MSETNDDGIRSEDLGYGRGANPQGGGGLGTALPGAAGGTPPTGTGEQVVDDVIDGASLETLPEGSQTPSTKPTTNTSSGSPAVNSPGATG